MYKIFLFSILASFSIATFGQISTPSFDYQAELSRTVNIPNSPEAQAFKKYGDNGINMYTGNANISVPLFNLAGKESNLLGSLTYDSSGIRVDQLSGDVGLAWNLNFGGRITRQVNGLPDDYRESAPSNYPTVLDPVISSKINQYIEENKVFADHSEVQDYFTFLGDINKNNIDTQPDYFTLNVFDFSETIVYDISTSSFIALDNPRTHITPIYENPNAQYKNIIGWDVVRDDGTIYEFRDLEETWYRGNDIYPQASIDRNYNSSYVITKIMSPNKKDTFQFYYEDNGFWNQFQTLATFHSASHIIDQNTPNIITEQPLTGAFVPDYKISTKSLESVKYNGVEMLKLSYGSRQDIGSNKKLSSIEINDFQGISYKFIEFAQSYFGSVNADLSAHKRLKLDEVIFKNASNDLIEKYSFSYQSPELVPPLSSLSRDYLGYYNGENNQSLIPQLELGAYLFEGANRDPNFDFAKIGLLTKIQYPTGGVTLYEYGPNEGPPNSSTTSNTTTETVSYALRNMTGALPSDSWCSDADGVYDCNFGYFMDLYGGLQPKHDVSTFTIAESGNYKLKYTDGNAGSLYQLRTLIFKLSDTSSNTTCSESQLPLLSQTYNSSGYPNMNADDRVFYSINDKGLLDSNDETTLFLEAGCYQIDIINPDNSINVQAWIYRKEASTTSSTNSTAEAAGMRVEKITSYTADHENLENVEPALVKKYVYKHGNNPFAETSANLLFRPTFYSVTTVPQPKQYPGGAVCGVEDYTSINLVAGSSGGSTPHIAYSSVFEIIEGQTENQVVQHKFYASRRNGSHSSGVAPNVSFYSKDASAGREIETYFNNSDMQATSHHRAFNEFKGYNYALAKGIYIRARPELSYSSAYSRPYGNSGNLTYDYSQWQYVFYDGTCGHSNPIADNDPDWTRINSAGQMPNFEMGITVAAGRISVPISTVSSLIFQENIEDDGIQKSTTYSYDPSNYLLRETLDIDSLGVNVRSTYTYPQDYNSPVYHNMVNANQTNKVLGTTTYYNNIRYGTKRNYEQIGNGFYMTSVDVSEKQVNPEIPLVYDTRARFQYNAAGNLEYSWVPLEGSSQKGNEVNYLWGYNSFYPVAKINNVSQSDIASLGLGPIGNGLTTAQESALRSNLPNAQVTTYTYKPLIGMTSQTDPRGYTMYYEYDELHRLKHVKDQDGNILSKNEYNYREND